MKPELNLMHQTWDSLLTASRKPTDLPAVNFDEIISSIFSAGPFYFYVIDFFDMSISNISEGFKAAHGVDPSSIATINDILPLMHPEDMEFVSQAEKKSYKFIYRELGVDKILRYKVSYNLRVITPDGSYKMFNHQALILTVDENGNFIKSLNIHTEISHLSGKNNHTFSLIGLSGEPSFLNMPVFGDSIETESLKPAHTFSRREIEIIRLLAEGFDTKNIADKLNISEETVKTHRKNINKKSGCRNSNELVARSMSEGWV